MQTYLSIRKRPNIHAVFRYASCVVVLSSGLLFGQHSHAHLFSDRFFFSEEYSPNKHVSLKATLRESDSSKDLPKSCLVRKIITTSLGTITVAGLVGWVAMDTKKDRIRSQINEINSVSEAIAKQIEWEETLSRRNLFGTVALGSGAALAVSFVIPIGGEDCDRRFLGRTSRRKHGRSESGENF